MPPTQAADSKELQAQLKAVADYVRDCERRVSRGEVPDMGALDQNVRALCDGATGLPREEGRALAEGLQALLADIDRLAAAMQARQKAGQEG